MLKRRSRENPSNGAAQKELPIAEGFKGCPNLWEFLTVQWWREERKPRITGTLLVFVEGGDVKLLLKDRDAGLQAFVTVQEGNTFLDQAEDALDNPKTDWRVVREPGANRPAR